MSDFYSRAEVKEVTVSSLARTIGDMLRTHISVQEHQKYHPITDELGLFPLRGGQFSTLIAGKDHRGLRYCLRY